MVDNTYKTALTTTLSKINESLIIKSIILEVAIILLFSTYFYYLLFYLRNDNDYITISITMLVLLNGFLFALLTSDVTNTILRGVPTDNLFLTVEFLIFIVLPLTILQISGIDTKRLLGIPSRKDEAWVFLSIWWAIAIIVIYLMIIGPYLVNTKAINIVILIYLFVGLPFLATKKQWKNIGISLIPKQNIGIHVNSDLISFLVSTSVIALLCLIVDIMANLDFVVKILNIISRVFSPLSQQTIIVEIIKLASTHKALAIGAIVGGIIYFGYLLSLFILNSEWTERELGIYISMSIFSLLTVFYNKLTGGSLKWSSLLILSLSGYGVVTYYTIRKIFEWIDKKSQNIPKDKYHS
ncbi:hypothetical protein GQS_06600 [Thermococcus sp. 4557]|nr:hypothetical protein GQS_06600 [Thermococcus sp. 4557]